MTYTYKLEIKKKHPIITTDDGRRLIVDTGATVTAGPKFRLCGESMPGGSIFVDVLKCLGGYRAKGLLGLDVLKKYHVVIDYPNEQIMFSDQPFGIKGERLTMNKGLLGEIGFDADINGRPSKVVFDTGAPISYVAANLVEGYEIVGHDKDFYPCGGKFDVDLHNVDLRIGDAIEMKIKAGVLPGMLALTAALMGDAIIGYDLLSRGQVELDFENGFITIGELGL